MQKTVLQVFKEIGEIMNDLRWGGITAEKAHTRLDDLSCANNKLDFTCPSLTQLEEFVSNNLTYSSSQEPEPEYESSYVSSY